MRIEMIKTKSDLKAYIESDRWARYGGVKRPYP